MKSSQKEAGFQYIHLTSAINNPPSKINKSRSPSFSLSPDRKSIVTSKRHSLLIQREKPDIFSPTISQSRKGHRMSVCTQEEEIELITRKIEEELLKQKKLDNLSILSNNCIIFFKERDILSFNCVFSPPKIISKIVLEQLLLQSISKKFCTFKFLFISEYFKISLKSKI